MYFTFPESPRPAPFAFLAIPAEFAGRLALILGVFGRVAALGLFVEMIVALAVGHSKIGFFMNGSGHQPGEGFEYHLLAGTYGFVGDAQEWCIFDRSHPGEESRKRVTGFQRYTTGPGLSERNRANPKFCAEVDRCLSLCGLSKIASTGSWSVGPAAVLLSSLGPDPADTGGPHSSCSVTFFTSSPLIRVILATGFPAFSEGVTLTAR